jgi:chromosome segregation ATPase
MSVDLATLPQAPDQLRLKLTEMAALLEQKEGAINTLREERNGIALERDHLKAAYEKADVERSHLKVAYQEAEAERRRLDAVLQQLLHRQSGPRSERLDPEQFQLALENVEQDFAAAAAAGEAAGNAEDVLRRRRPGGTWAICPSTCRTRRSASSRRTRPARAAAVRCTRSRWR